MKRSSFIAILAGGFAALMANLPRAAKPAATATTGQMPSSWQISSSADLESGLLTVKGWSGEKLVFDVTQRIESADVFKLEAEAMSWIKHCNS